MPDYGEDSPPDFTPMPEIPGYAPPPSETPGPPVTTEPEPPFEGGYPDPGPIKPVETDPSKVDLAGLTKMFDAKDPGFMSLLTQLGKAIGFTGDLKGLLPILPFLLSTFGSVNSADSKKEGAAKISNAADASNDFAKATLGNAAGGFTKYNNAGNEAVDQIMWHVNNDKPLTDKYGPVVAPGMPKYSGAMSLNDLAKVKG